MDNLNFYTTIIGLLFALSVSCTLVGRMGYSWWLGLLICVPVINLGLLLFILIRPWPVEEELAQRRLESGGAYARDARRVMGMAQRLVRKGKHGEAACLYELIEKRFADTELSRDAFLSRSRITTSGSISHE